MDRKSFVLYTASKGIIDELNIEQAGTLFKSIFELVTDGEPLDMDLPTKIAFKTIREYLERDFETYQAKCRVNRINGSKGGRPKGSSQKPKDADEDRLTTCPLWEYRMGHRPKNEESEDAEDEDILY